MIGPVQVTLTVHLVCGDRLATADVALPVGEPVSEKGMLLAIGQALEQARDQVGDAELMQPGDFFNKVIVKSSTGRIGRFATPKDFDYDASLVERAALELLQETRHG